MWESVNFGLFVMVFIRTNPLRSKRSGPLLLLRGFARSNYQLLARPIVAFGKIAPR